MVDQGIVFYNRLFRAWLIDIDIYRDVFNSQRRKIYFQRENYLNANE